MFLNETTGRHNVEISSYRLPGNSFNIEQNQNHKRPSIDKCKTIKGENIYFIKESVF